MTPEKLAAIKHRVNVATGDICPDIVEYDVPNLLAYVDQLQQEQIELVEACRLSLIALGDKRMVNGLEHAALKSLRAAIAKHGE